MYAMNINLRLKNTKVQCFEKLLSEKLIYMCPVAFDSLEFCLQMTDEKYICQLHCRSLTLRSEYICFWNFQCL